MRCRLAVARFIPTHVGNTTWLRRRSSDRPVHPHARGEHLRGLQLVCGECGSSPRTWGTRWRQAVGRGRRRFIPTHVGNTHGGGGLRCCGTVHPHARGEHTKSNSLNLKDYSNRKKLTEFSRGLEPSLVRPCHRLIRAKTGQVGRRQNRPKFAGFAPRSGSQIQPRCCFAMPSRHCHLLCRLRPEPKYARGLVWNSSPHSSRRVSPAAKRPSGLEVGAVHSQER